MTTLPRARCRQEKVTVNSLALAASYLAMAATCCTQHQGAEDWPGLRGQQQPSYHYNYHYHPISLSH